MKIETQEISLAILKEKEIRLLLVIPDTIAKGLSMRLPSCLFHNWKKQNCLQLKLESCQAQV